MKKVLIVDDAAFVRLAIKEILAKIGSIEFVEAVNGLDAVKKYIETKPDIVTMDITMPDMTGMEALKLIRKVDSEAKVIMITAMGQDTMVKEAVLNGAKSFIIKPFKEEHVISTVKKLLEVL